MKSKLVIFLSLIFLSLGFFLYSPKEIKEGTELLEKPALVQKAPISNEITFAKRTEYSVSQSTKEVIDYLQAELVIDAKSYKLPFKEGDSVEAAMERLKSEGALSFEMRNFAGLGKMVTKINGVEGDGDRNWIYYVNGKKAKVGISTYKLVEGDKIEWKLEGYGSL